MAQAHPTDGTGQAADAPREIPKQGWWDILKRVYASLKDKNLSILAAGVAFYAMLSVFPARQRSLRSMGLWPIRRPFSVK